MYVVVSAVLRSVWDVFRNLFRISPSAKAERELIKALQEENDAWARLSAEALEGFEKSFENENS